MERLRKLDEEIKFKEQSHDGAISPTAIDKKASDSLLSVVVPPPQATNIPIASVPVNLLKRPLPPVDINVVAKRPATRPAVWGAAKCTPLPTASPRV